MADVFDNDLLYYQEDEGDKETDGPLSDQWLAKADESKEDEKPDDGEK